MFLKFSDIIYLSKATPNNQWCNIMGKKAGVSLMFAEIENLKKHCHSEVKALRHQIEVAKRNMFFRWDAKAYIQQAEEKVQKIQELLVKLENLTDQIQPVVDDLKNIVGLKANKTK